jgi:hypothetical protein
MNVRAVRLTLDRLVGLKAARRLPTKDHDDVRPIDEGEWELMPRSEVDGEARRTVEKNGPRQRAVWHVTVVRRRKHDDHRLTIERNERLGTLAMALSEAHRSRTAVDRCDDELGVLA